jgi:L-ascorbate metabolism protein UlaG (beta-lactamase superfamily)
MGRVGTWLKRLALGLGTALVAAVAVALIAGCAAFGGRAQGDRRARMERSPQWSDGAFENPQPLNNHVGLMLKGMFDVSPDVGPQTPVPTARIDPARFATPPGTGLRVTWLGHSSLLVEIDGRRLLTDPVWADRASPFSFIGPHRWYAPLIALDQLPPIDAVLISHDHYDHLDHHTISALKDRDTTFIVPLGVAAHLLAWGVPERRIVELDWWEKHNLGGLTVVATPARHASGRMLIDNNRTLWASYAMVGPRHRVYFSGDTGLFPGMREIGERLGPFDLTMIEVGQYDPAWPDWHIGPEQAVVAHQMLRGKAFLPIHWALFSLAYHGWTEPIERVLAATSPPGSVLLTPRPGQSVEPTSFLAADVGKRWWPALPWKTAAQRPVVSTWSGKP